MKISFPQDPINEGSAILDTLFTSNWLDSLAENDDKGRTNREIQNEVRLVFCLNFFSFSKISPCVSCKKIFFLPLLKSNPGINNPFNFH